jgi:hypothetical protein
MGMRSALVVLVAALATAVASAAFARDGATITNSGSTNTAGWTMRVWSDGHGDLVILPGEKPATPALHTFAAPAVLASQFFADVKAAHDANSLGIINCMKTASFGSSTTVLWHGWNSRDFSCPQGTRPIAKVAADVRRLETAAGITGPGPLRIRLYPEPRRSPNDVGTPSPTPSSQP